MDTDCNCDARTPDSREIFVQPSLEWTRAGWYGRPQMADDARYQNEAALHPTAESSWGKLLQLVPESARVLEVGCAHGAFSSALKQVKKCQVIGVEIDAASAQTAQSRVDELFVGDIAALLKAGTFAGDFDAVIVADVLEHLLDPVDVLRRLAGCLKRGGAVLCSIPNVGHMSVLLSLMNGRFPRTREGLLDATHIHFFGEADVLKLFRAAGYAVRIVDRVQLDPRLTEFKSDLAGVSAPVLEYFDSNSNSLTYQFIVRAVPAQWAEATDDDPGSASPKPAGLAHNLVTEVARLETMVADYHRALTNREAHTQLLNRELAESRALLAAHEAAGAAEKKEAEALLVSVQQEVQLLRREVAGQKLSLDPLAHNELSDIDLIERGLGSVRFESKSNDPYIIFEARPFLAKDIKAIRFRLKHHLERSAQAQLFWTHAAGEFFSERKSARVPLTPGEWVQYAIHLDTPELKAVWEQGVEIRHVRFDPVDLPGAFEMGPLELLFFK